MRARRILISIGYAVGLWLPLQLAWHAILGWGDDQLAAWLGIKGPTVSQVYKALIEFGPSLVVAALVLWLYHLWWSREARANTGREIQPQTTARREGIEVITEKTKGPSEYLSGYEVVHYLADESEWGAEMHSHVSADGLKKNALLEAPGEFRTRAAEGKITVYGVSAQTGEHELIPKTHWMSYGLDLSKIYKPDAPSGTVPATFEAAFHGARSGKRGYADLKIEAAGVYEVWPRAKGDAEFDAAFDVAASSREEAISRLWDLRRIGVAIRNEPVPSEQLFPPWKAKYEQWRAEVLAAADKVNEGLRQRLEVLDRLRPPPSLPVVSNEHARCIAIASEILLRLEERLP